MMGKIIGAFTIVISCLGICFAIWHLIDKLKEPKNERIWWGTDVVIQMAFYPICVLGIIVGVYQFMI